MPLLVVEFRPIRRVPEKLARAFAEESEATEEYIKKFVLAAPVRIGIFCEGKLIGFHTSIPSPKQMPELRGMLMATSLYVFPRFRRRGLLHRTTHYWVQKARELKLDGVLVWDMVIETRKYFDRQPGLKKRQRDRLSFETISGEKINEMDGTLAHQIHGAIFLPKPNKQTERVRAQRRRR
jgi:hypothetical protein